jgi:hypothetical protein
LERLSPTTTISTAYQIIAAGENEFRGSEADAKKVNFVAGTLPPLKHIAQNLVDTALFNREKIADIPADSIKEVPFKSKFKLDYISNNASIGVSTGIYRNTGGSKCNFQRYGAITSFAPPLH